MNFSRALILGVVLVGCLTSHAGGLNAPVVRPRLAVVFVIDQFPREFLDRFSPLFGKHGFRRVLAGGANFRQAHHGHFHTATAPGHALMLTGTYPARNGVVGNYWYSRVQKKIVSGVKTPLYTQVGSSPAEGAAPLALEALTVGDVLSNVTSGHGRVFSMSLKDRSAVILGGRRPNGTFWFDPDQCRFVTSRYYADTLPAWVERFNAGSPCGRYIGGAWHRQNREVDYLALADRDDVAYEQDLFGLGRTFPHHIREWSDPAGRPNKDRFAPVAGSPFGSEMLLALARFAVEHEGLGSDDTPDLLAVSLSSNDYVGHTFGPSSQEVMDLTLRTDSMLADFLGFLDRKVGASQWLLVLTSDHGIASIPEYLEARGTIAANPAHYRFIVSAANATVEAALQERYFPGVKAESGRDGFIEAWDSATNPFVYINHNAVGALPGVTSREQLIAATASEIAKLAGVRRVYTADRLEEYAASNDPIEQSVARTWHRANGGDLLVQLEPNWIVADRGLGTNHGTPYAYDTHVPLIFYGPGVRAGQYDQRVEIADLAPTLSRLLGIVAPPDSEGRALVEAITAP